MTFIGLGPSLEISHVVAGFMRAPAAVGSGLDALGFVESCLGLGITTFDHADIYGQGRSGSIFGDKVLKRQPSLRDKMHIISKVGIVLPSEDRSRQLCTPGFRARCRGRSSSRGP